MIYFIAILYAMYAAGIIRGNFLSMEEGSNFKQYARVFIICLFWPYLFGFKSSQPKRYRAF